MDTSDTLRRGREAFERRAWRDAHAALSVTELEHPLAPEDLERLATAAVLAGRELESDGLWARAHHGFLDRGDVERAVRCAFWLAFGLVNRGERARAGGWVARARRLLDRSEPDSVEQGYLLLPLALQAIFEGDLAIARSHFDRAAAIGAAHGDPALTAFARHGRGRALIRMGEVEKGIALLDEAMAAVEAGEVPPLMAGDVYCSVVEACHETFDMRRAQEWTTALTRWCESQPDLVPYRGQCLVRRAELLQLHGDWSDASQEAQRACEWLLRPPPQRAAGAAFYQRAELHRLRGEFSEAEEAYRQASQWGRKPQPGLALMRLAQGQAGTAEAAIRLAVDEAHDPRSRCELLPPFVEIMIARSRIPAARAAADELAEISRSFGAPLPRAAAAQARGMVLLAEGDAPGALEALREACAAWEAVAAPYGAARVRFLIGLACRELGDHDSAGMELYAAHSTFRRLGAAPDLARLEAVARPSDPGPAPGLTPRELQVLRLVAAGKTNRSIARALFISERTVDRHVSNILIKLGVPSRAAATAHAYENDLLA